jgi:hypothetical protein
MPKLVNTIRALLRSGDKLQRPNDVKRRDLIRALTMLVNDSDERIRQRASRELGLIIAKLEPTAIAEFLRRLMWRINPESGDNSFGIPELVGEIGCEAPESIRPFVSVMLQYADDEQLLPGILQALGRIGQKKFDIVNKNLDLISSALTNPDPAVYGNAALALLRINALEMERIVNSFCSDNRKLRIFCNNKYQTVELCELVHMSDQFEELYFISREM